MPWLLSASLVDTDDHGMVSLERLESKLLLRLDPLRSELLNFLGEYNLRGGRTVDTVGLDRDDNAAADLEEQMSVQRDDTSLIGLRNVGEDAVDHGDEHAISERVSGVLDDGNDVGSVGGHVDEVTARSVREFDGVDNTGGSHDIRDVGNGGSGGGAEIQDLGARAHVDVGQTAQDTGSQLASERVPDTVFDGGRGLALGCALVLNGDALLSVDGLARDEVLGDEQIFLATSDEDASVTMRLLYDTSVRAPLIQLVRWRLQ